MRKIAITPIKNLFNIIYQKKGTFSKNRFLLIDRENAWKVIQQLPLIENNHSATVITVALKLDILFYREAGVCYFAQKKFNS